jgi:ABC-type transport system involved in multi-copper enzyme maturation permease subunit
MTSLLLVELLKMRKRWLPYLLFLVMVGGVAMLIWLGGFAEFHSSERDSRALGLHTMAVPWSLVALLDSGQFWGSFLVGVLVASGVATEYNWGTVRQALIRGQTRRQYLTVKLLGLATISAVSLLGALAIGMLFSVMATAIAGKPITLDVPDGPSVPEVVLIILRAGHGILPYALLAFCLTVVSRSTAMGTAGILIFIIGEAILSGILSGLGGPAPTIRAFLIGHNVSALLAANAIGPGEYNSMAFRELPVASELPDPGIAALVIAFYSALFLAIAYAVFQRRDLGVESGGG